MASTSGGIILRQAPISIFLVINKMGMVLVRTKVERRFYCWAGIPGPEHIKCQWISIRKP
jgi:hypothetical protein